MNRMSNKTLGGILFLILIVLGLLVVGMLACSTNGELRENSKQPYNQAIENKYE